MTFWRWKAPVYSLVRRLPLFRQIYAAEKKNLSQLLERFLPAPGLHLDLGSGTGGSIEILPPEHKRVVLDSDFCMLMRNPGSKRVVARAEALPFPAQSFAFLSAIGLSEYIDRTEEFLHEVRRVLKPGGYFLFTTSPPNLANHLRWLWGEKLHLLAAEQVKLMLAATGWHLLGHSRSWLQEQWMVAYGCSEVGLSTS
jgi:ubiquinone/menaquinone biosynthesis C-methylase UbiE